MKMGKTEKGEEILPVFGGKQQRRTVAFPNLPSLLFLSILDLVTPTRRAAQGGVWRRVWRWGRVLFRYCITPLFMAPYRGPARLVT